MHVVCVHAHQTNCVDSRLFEGVGGREGGREEGRREGGREGSGMREKAQGGSG